MLSQLSINANDVWQAADRKHIALTHTETCQIRDIAAQRVNEGVLAEIEAALFAVVSARPNGNQPGLFDERGNEDEDMESG